MALDTTKPFVLLDDARASGAAPARLYTAPVDTVTAQGAGSVRAALEKVEAAQVRGLHAVGFLSYELGHALEPRLRALQHPGGDLPLIWFGLFERYETIAPDAVPALLPDPAGAWASPPRPLITRGAYEVAIARVQNYIAAGDIYQANLTFQAEVKTLGHPLALYAKLRQRAQAGYGGVVFTGHDWLLSLSPELFFALQGGRLTTRPMKGTATRGKTTAQDAAAIRSLREDPKQRAENLMIVDLLRNDLSRVAVAGSVQVPDLFKVETYPTVHQMTSTVTASLAPGKRAVDVIRAIYPCGSITGAPKIRAMEVIAEVEAGPRHAYTGAIGRLDPNDDAAFNVAIRTLHLKEKETRAVMGLGSGIVADSRSDDEWSECLAKGAFVHGADSGFDIVETMGFDPSEGVLHLERHLARMRASAEIFGFAYNHHAARNELQAATFRLRAPARVRLMLGRSGALAVEIRAIPRAPQGPAAVSIVPLPVHPSDFRLRHKTSDRAFHEQARSAAGSFEVVFRDPSGFLTEGSFTSIFVERGGKLLTPPLSRGLLPGVLRGALIDEGRAIEADLTPADLSGSFWIGNAVRGLLPARLASPAADA
ncbi:aminodeoxychorismate synthase component I [Sphingomonas sp. LaA6.9]|uniref:aminodeoxychorismate synthase component I n=1 Tax=Sphingomonas sp. LaA6.9 TaxID=2919914 RepID=UPI001F4FD20B|nr:aminodeoxychorismate synthase component I [Sphingomonas sp. LaA6.9]MCJ8157285.1 aminodeoxychorismate synthase component I [Sphingomonas sp. LaA6.9]